MTRRMAVLWALALLFVLLLTLVLGYCDPGNNNTAMAQDQEGQCQLLWPDKTWEWIDCPITTATPFNTPTPEITMQPTLTPEPTNTPQPIGCWGTVTADVLNVRNEPWGSVVYQVTYGQVLTFDAKWYKDFWWWRIEWDGGWVSSNYIKLGDTANCDGLQDVTPRASELSVGFFSMPNGNVWEQVQAVGVAAGKNIVFGTHVYANASTCTQVMDAGGICVYRHGDPDCPTAIFQGDPRAKAREFMGYDAYFAEGVFQNPAYKGLIYIDPLNECNWGDTVEELTWWAYFLDELVTQAIARNWPPLQIPSPGPGYGNYLMFSVWKPVLMKNHANGGMFSMHVYNPVSTWLCPENQWLADRASYNYAIIQSLDYDVRISITEVGQGWGDTPPNIPDMTCWTERMAQLPYIVQVYIWEAGLNFTWINGNWEGKVVEFIQALDGALWG